MLQGYVIKDDKAQMFLTPFFVKNVILAIRTVLQVAQDPQINLNKFADDFSLYHICEWDDETGDLSPIEPNFIVGMRTLLEQSRQQQGVKNDEPKKNS